MSIKMSLLFLPIIIVFFIGDEITYRTMNQSFYSETIGASIESLENIAAHVDNNMSSITNTLSALSKDQALNNYIDYYTSDNYVSGRGTNIENLLANQMRTLSSSLSGIDSIGVILSPQRIKQLVFNEETDIPFIIKNFAKTNDYDQSGIIPLNEYNKNSYLYLYPFTKGSLSFSLFAVLNENFFQNTFESIGRSGANYYIYDEDALIFSITPHPYNLETVTSMISSATFPEFLVETSGFSRIASLEEDTYVVSFIPNMNLTIVSQQANIYPYRYMYTAYASNLLIRLIITTITFILFWFIIRSFSKRIREINTTMEKIEAGDLNFRFSPVYSDEISQLGRHLNKMVTKIRIQESEIAHKKIQVKEAQLKSLQNQINPHFLYNSLENIRMQAVTAGNIPIANQIEIMGAMLRYNIKNDLGTVTIKQEYEQVQRYLSMQKYLLGERLQVSLYADPSVLNCYVLKFLLQPLVENSIIHGISNKPSPSELSITILDSGDRVSFCISDTGQGIHELRLDEIRTRLAIAEPTEDESNSIGLHNVNSRLILFYGKESALHIDSTLGTGTTITFSVPVNQE